MPAEKLECPPRAGAALGFALLLKNGRVDAGARREFAWPPHLRPFDFLTPLIHAILSQGPQAIAPAWFAKPLRATTCYNNPPINTAPAMANASHRDFNLRLAERAKSGRAEELALLLAEGASANADYSIALCAAALSGHADCVRLLISAISDEAAIVEAIYSAVCNNHAECLEILAASCAPSVDHSRALHLAAERGHAECARILIPLSQSLLGKKPIVDAALQSGCADTLALMLAREPRLLNGYNLSRRRSSAITQGHARLACLLSSIIDHEELSGVVSVDGSLPPSRSSRL